VSLAAESRSRSVTMSYLDAIVRAQVEEMERDRHVIMIGEDLSVYGDGQLVQRFDTNRVWSTPISEGSFTGIGIGAAIFGLRPIVALNIASFVYLASDQIINQAAKLPYMTGGQIKIPVVIRCCMFYGSNLAAQHSDRPYPMFMNVPGLKILSPTTPAGVKGLLKAAVRDEGPVLLFEDTKLWTLKGEVPTDPDFTLPIGQAEILRKGGDLTIVAIAGAMRPALAAAARLSTEGISVEVIDPRTLKPLDFETILGSVAKTKHLLIIENAHRTCAVSAEIAATIAEQSFGLLRRPIVRLTAPDVHVPFSPVLEEQMFPNEDRVVATVKKILQ
jgi:acetoin:2,6-dichlorophenolindophenol oxidoreductase subunit beta